MELDTTKLSQSGSKKLTPHDNCTVLDLDLLGVGSSVYPRVIEIRIPGIDGARQSALWDGSLDLAVDDVVIADEYAGQSIWRVSGMGGDGSGAGKLRVNKVWASDFSSVSLVTDASDNVTINTGTLDLAGGADGRLGIGTASPDRSFVVEESSTGTNLGTIPAITVRNTNAVGKSFAAFSMEADDGGVIGEFFADGDDSFGAGSDSIYFRVTTGDPLMFGTTNTIRVVITAAGQVAFGGITSVTAGRLIEIGSTSPLMKWSGHASSDDYTIGMDGSGFIFFNDTDSKYGLVIANDNNVGINGVNVPSTELDIGAGAIEFNEMTAPGAGAANTARLFSRDDGSGDTELCVRFATGLIQVIAPLEFGEISVIENGTATALTVTTPAQFLFFDTNGPANGATPDHTNDHITVGKDGTYLIVASLSAEGAAGSSYQIETTILKNNGATQVGQLHAHRAFAGGSGDFGSISMSGLAVLAAGDTIELWIENLTSSQDITLEDCTLSITMIGVNA